MRLKEVFLVTIGVVRWCSRVGCEVQVRCCMSQSGMG